MTSSRVFVLATRNAHKVVEFRRILAPFDVELKGIDDFSDVPEVDETGSTFAANALLKARAVSEATGHPAIADDSGICVDALNGMPGVLSARWSGRDATDAGNLQLLLDQLEHVPDERRDAQFRCAIAIVVPGEDERVFEGEVEGVVIRAPRGDNGFGYDPVFVPYGSELTTAEMRDDQKDAVSHRGQALRAMAAEFQSLL